MYMYTAFPTINMKETGKRIQSLRQQRGLSVKDVQNYFGFAYPQAIYKWQHGECLPTVDNLFALYRLLQVNMEDLLVIDREVHFFVGEFLSEGGPFHVSCGDRTVKAESRLSKGKEFYNFGIKLQRMFSRKRGYCCG